MIQTQFRRAHTQDATAILELETRFPVEDRISRHSLLRLLRGDSSECIVAERHSILGAAILLYRDGRSLARLYSISVHETALGTGIGRGLIDACIDAATARGCDRLRLEVRPSNTSAIALYKRSGFIEIGRKAAYYDNGEDALQMERTLTTQTGSSK